MRHAALKEFVEGLHALGFSDPDEPVSGADTVDHVAKYYDGLKWLANAEHLYLIEQHVIDLNKGGTTTSRPIRIALHIESAQEAVARYEKQFETEPEKVEAQKRLGVKIRHSSRRIQIVP